MAGCEGKSPAPGTGERSPEVRCSHVNKGTCASVKGVGGSSGQFLLSLSHKALAKHEELNKHRIMKEKGKHQALGYPTRPGIKLGFYWYHQVHGLLSVTQLYGLRFPSRKTPQLISAFNSTVLDTIPLIFHHDCCYYYAYDKENCTEFYKPKNDPKC